MQSLHGLCIELFVIDGRADINRSSELDTQKTTATRRICQHIRLVGGGYERGTTREILNMSAIGSFNLYLRERDDILQESLLCTWGYLVELIEVDEQHLSHLL